MSVHPSPELRVLFEAALNEFEIRTGTDLVRHQIFSRLVACESIESVLDILREQTKPLRTSRGDDSILMKFVKRTVGVLHSLSTDYMVVSGVSSAIPPAKAVFAGIAILLSAIKDVDKSYDALVDLFECFESVLRRLDNYTKIPSTPAITEVIVKILTELLSIISLAIQQVKQGRLKKLWKKFLRENDREVEAILQRLDQLTLEEARMTGTMTLEVVYDLLKNVKMVMDDKSMFMDDIRRALVVMQQVASGMNKLRRDQLGQDVRRWLSPPDPSINHHIARNFHHEGSAEWFIHGNTFQQWKMRTGSLLWVYGKPGSGKSILSSSIIEDIKISREMGLASIAYFYFDFRDESKTNARGALSSILAQLAARSDPYSEMLSALYSEHYDGFVLPSDDALRRSLESMLAIPDQAPIYIVVDALDECPNNTSTPSPRENVLCLVEWLLELRCSNLRISVTSRPESDIVAVLQPLASYTICLHNETGQKEDITNYIKWFVNSDPKARRWRKQDKELVIERLSERADGMFRWVFCQLDLLRRRIITRIRQTLDELPETLDETYERTLLDIDKENWEYAHRLFQCLVVSIRPLRVEELAEFLAFEFEGGEAPIFYADWRPEDPIDAVLSTCSSLISVVDDDGSAIVEFSHFSVKEYLTSTRIADGRVLQYYTPLEPAHILVARACLSILLQLDDELTNKRMKDFPLLGYAVQYWVEHAKFGNASSQIEDMVKRVFDPRNPLFPAWSSMYNMDPTDNSRIEYSRPTPLYYAALFNFCGVAEWLVKTHSQNVNALGGYYGTPLHAAAAAGSLEVAQSLLVCHADGNHVTVPRVLLDEGANINAINDRGETPLTVALKHGPMKTSMEATNLLLGHGANPNSTGRGESPIYAVLSPGHCEVVRLLRTNGADPDYRDDDGKTQLHAASEKGDLNLAWGLSEFGADINSCDNQGRTPLHVIGRESEDVALLLLERGANPDVRDDVGQTPLHVASRSGSLKIAQRLLEHGSDVNSRDNQGRTPLHVIRWGSEDIALLLLEHGADPDVRDDVDQTPLHAASRSGSLTIARQLLEHGFDVNSRVNSRDNQGRTPLHVIQRGGEDVALLLLDCGADPGVQDNAGQTPLHAASRSGSLMFALRLLTHGVGVNSRDNQGRTPLHVIQWGSEDVALLLLERGAEPDIWDDAGQTPLHAASRSGSLKIARQLLGRGCDVNLGDNQGRTPLHVIQSGIDDVALLFLESGADPGIQDDSGQTPLHAASRSGSLKFTRRLLELGVEVDSHDNHGRTPLHVIEWWGNDVRLPLLLLESGADQGVRDNDGYTPLHAIARWGKLNITQRLLELGLDVNWEDYQGRTYFDRVAQWCEDVSLLFLEYGADPGVRNNDGQTPFQVALREGNMGVAQQLLKFDVDANSHDRQGRISFRIAVGGGHDKMEKLPLEHGAEMPSSESTKGGGAENPSSESMQSDGAEMPSSESTQSGGVEMPSSKSTQSGGAEMPSSESTKGGGAENPSSESMQSDGAEMPSSKSTQSGGAEMPSSESTQSDGAEMPSSKSTQSGGTKMPSSKQSGDAARRTTCWETALPLWWGMLPVFSFLFVLFLYTEIQSRYDIYSTIRT